MVALVRDGRHNRVISTPADTMPINTDSTHTASVDRAYHWLPITPDTPRGVKMQLINCKAGVAAYGTLGTDPFFWTHYAPLPTFKEDDK